MNVFSTLTVIRGYQRLQINDPPVEMERLEKILRDLRVKSYLIRPELRYLKA
jgi:hypothetical protein